MLLSYLIIALSVSFAPLAQGRPAGAPAGPLNSSHASAEPGTLLGRHYSIQERREPSVARLPRASYAGYARPAGYGAVETPRRWKPYAKYLAERSDDVWAHEHSRRVNAGAPNYVSHVGPPSPPAAPAEPVAPLVAFAPPTAPTAPVAPTGPISTSLNPNLSSTSAVATSTAASVSTSSTSSASTLSSSATPTPTISKKVKNIKAKSKSKTHKDGKQGEKS